MTDRSLTEKVSFDFIRYANCWEDAEVMLNALRVGKGEQVLSIASAGDNSFSLLTTDAELVVAIDVNPQQLWLLQLKKEAILAFDHEQLIGFLGFREMPAEKRLDSYRSIRGSLPPDARNYWDNHLSLLEHGVVHAGKFERYFRTFASRVLPFIHSGSKVEALMSAKSDREQALFYNEQWNTWRWKTLFRIFFSKYMMGKYGRDPEFMRHVEVSVGKSIYTKAGIHLRSVLAQDNHMLRYALTGSFGKLLPHYLEPANLEKIRSSMGKLQLIQGYAEQAISYYGGFHAMNLSNIFEYMDRQLFHETSSDLIQGLRHGGRMVYWNLLVPRRISDHRPEKLILLEELSQELTVADRGFFYNRVIAEQRI